MKTKVESLVRLAEKKKIESVILNAGQPGALESTLCGQRTIDTLIRPDPKYG
jgi:acetylglutamate kinase